MCKILAKKKLNLAVMKCKLLNSFDKNDCQNPGTCPISTQEEASWHTLTRVWPATVPWLNNDDTSSRLSENLLTRRINKHNNRPEMTLTQQANTQEKTPKSNTTRTKKQQRRTRLLFFGRAWSREEAASSWAASPTPDSFMSTHLSPRVDVKLHVRLVIGAHCVVFWF